MKSRVEVIFNVFQQGSFEELISSQGIFSQVIGEPAGDDLGTDENERSITPLKSILRQISSSSQQSLQAIKDDESVYQASENEKEEPDQEQTDEGAVNFSTYRDYWTLGGSCFAIFFMVFLFIATQFAASAADMWVAYWTTTEQTRINNDDEISDDLISTENCILIYSILVGSLFVTALSRSFLFYVLSMRSSLRLHDKMFQSLVRAPMHFFSWNPTGRILNRFASLDKLIIYY